MKTRFNNKTDHNGFAAMKTKELKTFPDAKTQPGVIKLTQDQLKDIIESGKDIERGRFVENSLLDKQVRQWLSAR